MPKQVNLHDGQWRGAFDSKGRAIILVRQAVFRTLG